MNFEQWQSRGSFTTVDGHQIFYIDTKGNNPPLLILHGFPTCSYDYYKVIKPLSSKFRVIIHDHLGFGLSDKPSNFRYSLFDQCDIAIKLWSQLGLKDGIILGHDYGTSVLTEMVARENEGKLSFQPKGYILTNGSMLIRMAKMLPIQFMLRHPTFGPIVAFLSNAFIFKRNMKKIYYDTSKLEQDELDVLWQMITYKGGKARIPAISQYSLEREEHWDRWIGGLNNSQAKFLILWAENDPIAVPEMADELVKIVTNSTLVRLSKTGHYPMLERPLEWSNAILKHSF